jgi:hypothetical protein
VRAELVAMIAGEDGDQVSAGPCCSGGRNSTDAAIVRNVAQIMLPDCPKLRLVLVDLPGDSAGCVRLVVARKRIDGNASGSWRALGGDW